MGLCLLSDFFLYDFVNFGLSVPSQLPYSFPNPFGCPCHGTLSALFLVCFIGSSTRNPKWDFLGNVPSQQGRSFKPGTAI